MGKGNLLLGLLLVLLVAGGAVGTVVGHYKRSECVQVLRKRVCYPVYYLAVDYGGDAISLCRVTYPAWRGADIGDSYAWRCK